MEVRLGHAHRDLLRVTQFDDLPFRFGLRFFVHDQLHQLRLRTTFGQFGVGQSQVSSRALHGP